MKGKWKSKCKKLEASYERYRKNYGCVILKYGRLELSIKALVEGTFPNSNRLPVEIILFRNKRYKVIED